MYRELGCPETFLSVTTRTLHRDAGRFSLQASYIVGAGGGIFESQKYPAVPVDDPSAFKIQPGQAVGRGFGYSSFSGV